MWETRGSTGGGDRILIQGEPLSQPSRGSSHSSSGSTASERQPLLGRSNMAAANTVAQTTPEGAGDAPAAAAAPVVIENTDQSDMAKRVLRKIDRTIIPLLFVTYMFNFMDKIILSSAAVFGLRDDTVSIPPPICSS